MCAKNHALGTRTKCELEILSIIIIYHIVYFREIILESSRNGSDSYGHMTGGYSIKVAIFHCLVGIWWRSKFEALSVVKLT